METTATAVVDELRRRTRNASRVSSIVLISLLVSQRYHGIDLGRTAGGNRGGYNSDQNHRDRHRNARRPADLGRSAWRVDHGGLAVFVVAAYVEPAAYCRV